MSLYNVGCLRVNWTHSDQRSSPMTALLTVPEAQQRLRIGRSLLFRLLADRTIPSVRLGRRRLIPESAIEKFVASSAEGLNDER